MPCAESVPESETPKAVSNHSPLIVIVPDDAERFVYPADALATSASGASAINEMTERESNEWVIKFSSKS